MIKLAPLWHSARLQWLGFISGWLIISYATLTPMTQLPDIAGSDKLHHVVGFASWALLCAFGPRKSFLLMAIAMILWGGAIELIQPSVNRHSEWADFIADGLGVVLIILATTLIPPLLRKTS